MSDENQPAAPQAPAPSAAPAAPPTMDQVLAAFASEFEAPPDAPAPSPEPAAAAPEPPAAQESTPEPSPPPPDDRLLRLMEQERSLRERSDSLSQREAETERLRAEAETRAQKADQYRKIEEAIYSKDASAFAEALGADPLDLAESLRQGTPLDPSRVLEKRMREELAQRDKALEELKSRYETDRRTQMVEAARSEVLREITEKSPALAALARVNPGLPDAVIERVQTLYRETGKAPALDQVIPELQQEATAQATALFEALMPHLDSSAKDRLRALMAPQGDRAGSMVTTEQRRPQLTLTNARTAEATNFEPPKEIIPGADNELEQYLAKYGL